MVFWRGSVCVLVEVVEVGELNAVKTIDASICNMGKSFKNQKQLMERHTHT
jgi:hypothetical protein